MRVCTVVCLLFLISFLVTGCWDKSELTEFGYAQAVAVDKSGEGKVELHTLFYNPTSGGEPIGGMTKQTKQPIIIKSSGATVFEAVRDIPIHLGRIPKWDHMRVILIGEDIIKKQSVAEVLDFFSRDHEPRATIQVLIPEGRASSYLEIKPFIEQTIGQQLREIEESSSKYSAKTSKIPLLDLAIQLKGETDSTMLPYVYKVDEPNKISVAGNVLLKDGKMKSVVSPADTRRILMLANKYKSGILQFPCMGESGEQKKVLESFEVTAMETKLTPEIKNNKVIVHVLSRVNGSVGELHCTILKSKKDGERFTEKIEGYIEGELSRGITLLQKHESDVIGIGDRIYRKKPALWKSWKPTWDQRFQEIQFVIDVHVALINTGLNIGTPFSK